MRVIHQHDVFGETITDDSEVLHQKSQICAYTVLAIEPVTDVLSFRIEEADYCVSVGLATGRKNYHFKMIRESS